MWVHKVIQEHRTPTFLLTMRKGEIAVCLLLPEVRLDEKYNTL